MEEQIGNKISLQINIAAAVGDITLTLQSPAKGNPKCVKKNKKQKTKTIAIMLCCPYVMDKSKELDL